MSFAQDSLRFSRAFYDYLINQKAYTQAGYLIDQHPHFSLHKDSLQLLRVRLFLHEQQIENAQAYWQKNTWQAPNPLLEAHLAQYAKKSQLALEKIGTLPEKDTFYWAATMLLAQKSKETHLFLAKYPAFQDAELLQFYSEKSLLFKKKSYFVGALASAILPGSGKFYAGAKGGAASSLGACLFWAMMSAEAYRVNNSFWTARGLTFTSIFTLFYVGNIWGTVGVIKKRRDAFYHQIRLDLRPAMDSRVFK